MIKTEHLSIQETPLSLEKERIKDLRKKLQNPASIEAIRANNMRIVCSTFGGQTAVGRKLGHKNPGGRINHIVGVNPVRSLGEKSARQVEEVFGLEPYWMDKPHPSTQVVTVEIAAEVKTPIQLSNVAWSSDIARQCLRLLGEQSLQPSLEKFVDLFELVLTASAENNGVFDKHQTMQLIKLLK